MRGWTIGVLAAFALGAPALANDTSVTLGAGGLQFQKSDAIEMVSEDLFVSMDEVRVRYVFRNKTARDVKTLVAFPLPDLKAEYQESPVDIPAPDSANFVDFKTSVDGAPVALDVEHKAFLNGVDKTAVLVAAGAPLNPLLPKFFEKIKALSAEARATLIADGLLGEDTIDMGNGVEPYWRPMWDLQTAFYREQVFPAGKSVSVEHVYKPVIGGTVAPVLALEFVGPDELPRYQKDYCVTPRFVRAEKKLDVSTTQERWLTYILKTGANWAGPIQDFTLTVDKGKARNLVSFCGKGVKKISPTQFRMKAKNFTPRDDLNVLFVIPNPQ